MLRHRPLAALVAFSVLAVAGCAASPAAQAQHAAAASPVPASGAAAPTPSRAPVAAPAPKAVAPLSTTVVYEVTSDRPLQTVSYTDGSANPGTDVAAPSSPWTKTLSIPVGPGPHIVSLTAGTGSLGDGSTVTCRISVDGTVKVQNSGTGATICVASW